MNHRMIRLRVKIFSLRTRSAIRPRIMKRTWATATAVTAHPSANEEGSANRSKSG